MSASKLVSASNAVPKPPSAVPRATVPPAPVTSLLLKTTQLRSKRLPIVRRAPSPTSQSSSASSSSLSTLRNTSESVRLVDRDHPLHEPPSHPLNHEALTRGLGSANERPGPNPKRRLETARVNESSHLRGEEREVTPFTSASLTLTVRTAIPTAPRHAISSLQTSRRLQTACRRRTLDLKPSV